MVNAGDFDRFKALQWGIRTWDVWNFMECDPRFGDDWPGRIPAQLVAHILYFFSEPGDLVLDPMAGGGVCADTCLAMGRRCWSLTHLIQAPMSSERFTGGVGDGNPHFEPNARSNPNS